MNKAPQLYVRPAILTFDEDHQIELANTLNQLTANTLATDISELRDLHMSRDGELDDGFRFTATGFRQVCNIICDSSFRVISDLAGVGRDVESCRDDYSFVEAVRLYNRLIDQRFDNRLRGKFRLLRNLKEKLIDGVHGPRYHLVENSEIYSRACEAASRAAGGLKFYNATLIGRRLMLRFIRPKPFLSVPKPPKPGQSKSPGLDRYCVGLHFANSEIGGESTIRAAPLLQRRDDGTTSMGPFFGGRQLHTGREFSTKLAVVFSKAADSEPDQEKTRQKFLNLQEISLGSDYDSDAAVEDRVEQLASLLHQHAISKRTSREIVLDAIYHGSYVGDGLPVRHSRYELSKRTAYDLYCSLTRRSGGLYASIQEAIEQAAYALLVGRIRIP